MSNIVKSIIITGATSGIGNYATQLFADRGWIVWAGYRAEKDKKSLLKINPKLVRPLHIDVTDQRSITQAHAAIVASGIPLNVLCNNAGVAFGGPIELLDILELKKAFDVNFFGPVRMIQKFLPLLRQTSGRIVNVGSLSGLVGVPFEVPTSSPKFALEGMSDSLRREIEGQNVKVVVIEPGIIQTEIWQKALDLSLKLLKAKKTELNLYQQAIDKHLSLLEHNQKFFMPVRMFQQPLIHAVESQHPKTRYLVYQCGTLLAILLKLLPDKVLDWVFRKILS